MEGEPKLGSLRTSGACEAGSGLAGDPAEGHGSQEAAAGEIAVAFRPRQPTARPAAGGITVPAALSMR